MKRILYDVSRWSVYLHRDARALDPVERDDPAPRQFEDELFEMLYAGAVVPLPESERNQELKNWAERVHGACQQLPAFSRLSQDCRGDAFAAAVAVESLTSMLTKEMQAGTEQDEPALRRSLRGACEKAAQAVEEVRDAAEGLGLGAGRQPGTVSAGPNGPARALLRRLKDDARLRRIALLAGRFKRIAAAKQRSKAMHGMDEIAEIEQGADLGRLLPVELMKLGHPLLRLALRRDLLERQCLQYQLKGTSTLGKGPLIVCLDKSGSMDGPCDAWATASALALLDIAHQQGRPFGLIGFDAQVKYETLVPVGGLLPEGGLFIACSGGTNIHRALSRGIDIIEDLRGSWKQADLIVVTDGASDATAAENLRARMVQLGVSVLGIGIGVDASALTPWCDRVETITDLDRMEDGAAELLFAN